MIIRILTDNVKREDDFTAKRETGKTRMFIVTSDRNAAMNMKVMRTPNSFSFSFKPVPSYPFRMVANP